MRSRRRTTAFTFPSLAGASVDLSLAQRCSMRSTERGADATVSLKQPPGGAFETSTNKKMTTRTPPRFFLAPLQSSSGFVVAVVAVVVAVLLDHRHSVEGALLYRLRVVHVGA